MTVPIDHYLGAARVLRRESSEDGSTTPTWVVALEAADDQPIVNATCALAFPYRPVIGDQLLVIGDVSAFFIIGVLAGRGRSKLSDAHSVQASGGRLKLAGDRGITLGGPRIDMRSQHYKKVALTTVRTFGDWVSRVREAARVEAGELDAVSQNSWLLQGRRIVLKALTGARVNSTTVRLG